MQNVNNTKKKWICWILAVLVMLILSHIYLDFRAYADRDSVRALFARKQERLLEIAGRISDGELVWYEDLALADRLTLFRCGLVAVHGANQNGLTAFSFSGLPEGSLMLCYSPNGEAGMLAYVAIITCCTFDDIPESGARIDGLGIDRKGFVYCERLTPDWFLMESYLPT